MKRLNDKAIKGLLALIVIIAITSLLVRSMKGSETLRDYADNHPEEQVTAEIISLSEEETRDGADGGKRDVAGDDGDQALSGQADTETETEDATLMAEQTLAEDTDEYADSDLRYTYQEGFYYEPVPESVRERMRGLSYPDDIDESKVSFDNLRYLSLKYVDFEGNSQTGEMVCNESIARDLVEIFYELYKADYRIESIKLIDEFGADDTASMAANNTSCFCYRVVDGTSSLSNHAYGRAVDLNPFYNPYIVFKAEGDYISPAGSEIYADRSKAFPYKIDENDLAYRLFKEHGFRWGGDWNSCKDYQHFDKKN